MQARQWLRGTSLPDRSPEGGAVKVSLAFARVYLRDGCSFLGLDHNQGVGFVYDA